MAKAREEDEDTLDELLKDNARVEEVSSSDENEFDKNAREAGRIIPGIPFHGKGLPKPKRQLHDLPPWLNSVTINLFQEDLETATSEAQKKTTAECLPLLTGEDTQGLELNSYGIPHLRRHKHADFLRETIKELPAPYQVIDASRPWFFYWSMAGLSFLGEDVSVYKERLMDTVRPLQNPTGGFGGGHGQDSHCACSYATVLALAAVGGLEVVDRKTMWQWLGTVKQADGGFRMAINAEEDVRGAYSSMTIISLLNLPLELPPDAPARKAGLTSFTDGLGEWLGRCQTYEGGVAGAPTHEAHGAYAFCALACLCILDAPHLSIPKYFDIQALVRWLASVQATVEGGFGGRTNKLVDACYSHWVGGCWSLIEAAVAGTKSEVSDLWSREALIRYLLTCCQQPGKRGGMRDKPSTRPDGYHTCYSLSGLSAAQNHYSYDVDADTIDSKTGRLTAAFNWTASKASAREMEQWKCVEEDVVVPVHPVFVVPMKAVESATEQFEKGGF